MIQIKKLKTPTVKLLAQGHITSRKQNQGLNPRLPNSTEFFLHDCSDGSLCWCREMEIGDPKVFNRALVWCPGSMSSGPALLKSQCDLEKGPSSLKASVSYSVKWTGGSHAHWGSLKVLKCPWAHLCFVILHAHSELGSGIEGGVTNFLPKLVRKVVKCALFQGCTEI